MKEEEIKRNSYIWNTVSGMINAGQSAIILVMISHVYSIVEAGIFSIGYAISLLGMTLSKFGQRNYQVTDVDGEFSFLEYRTSRIITIAATLLFLTCYLLAQFLSGNYNYEKLLIVFLICLWKQIDSFEDVYYGMYQQKGRLDIGAKRYSGRLIISTILFSMLILLKIRFSIAVLIVVISSVFVAAIMIQKDSEELLHEYDYKHGYGRVERLLFINFTLCISSTLAVYIGNLPKYFIDVLLEDSVQAMFGYLIMPAFVIMVLSTVIFQPIVREMGEAVKEGDYKRLSGYVRRQIVYIGVITVMVIIIGAMFGIPVLDFLYHADLTEFWVDLIILLAGGGFYALSQFMIVPIISMRKQKDITYIYLIVAIISIITGIKFISMFELRGASLLYLIINVILSLLLLLDYFVRLRQMQRESAD